MKILHVVFIVGAATLAFCVTGPYPVLGAGPLLLGVGALVFLLAGILTAAPEEVDESDAARKSIWGPRGAHYIFIALAPWILAGILIANGALDRSPEVDHQTTVVNTVFGRSWWVYVTVESWQPGRSTETVFVKQGFDLRTGHFWPAGFFLEGDPITIGVRSGAFGMPWVCRISQGHLNMNYPHGSS